MTTRSPAYVAGLAACLFAAMLIPHDTLAATSPNVEAAIKSLETIPSNAEKFQAYCNVLGEMEGVPEADAAKSEALEGQLDEIIASYGKDVAQAWEVATETDPDSDDGQAIAAAFEALEAKCP
ncbi:MAG: hypothetical protein AB7U75_16955 [Hyphomicrobiaceae bacterium]